MKRHLITALLILACASPARAFMWAWDGAETEPLQSTDASCAKAGNDGGGASGDHSYITMACDDTTTEGFIVHFHRPYGIVALESVLIRLSVKPASATGIACSEVTIGCAASATSMTWGTPVRQSKLFGSLLWDVSTDFAVTFPNNLYDFCAVRVRRVHGDGACPDTMAGDLMFRAGYAE